MDSIWPAGERPKLKKQIAFLLDISERPPDILAENCVLILPTFQLEQALAVAFTQGFFHFLPLEHPHLRFLLAQTCSLLNEPIAVIKNLEKMLLSEAKNSSPVIQTFKPLQSYKVAFVNTAEKTRLLEKLGTTLDAHPATRLVKDNSLAIVDELMMNALYDAPREALGKSSDIRPVEFFYLCDKNYLILGCTDLFGSLNARKLLARLNTVWVQGRAQAMNYGPGGAGLGTAMILDCCADLLAVIEIGKRTTVLATVPLGISRKKAAQHAKSLRLIEIP